MSKQIFEETGGPHRGHAAGDTNVEKQASQLASDVKYKVKKSMSGATHMNPAQVAKAYLAQLAKSPAPPAVKALAKKKIMGEEYTSDIGDLVKESVSKALNKVFVEGITFEEEVQVKEESESSAERRYKVRVKDKKTGNTYVTSATRAKIAELRANPNISSVEMTEYGEPTTDEKTKGKQTASVKAGKGLNNDGNLANNYPPYDKVTRGDVIAGATGKDQMGGKKKLRKEEFIGEVKKEEAPKVEGLKKGKKNKVKIFPDVSEQVTATKEPIKKTTEDPKEKQSAQALDRTKQQEIQILQRKLQALRSAPKGTDPSIMASYEPKGEQIDEKITDKTDMGAAIKDFYASKSPQLAGRTKEQRRQAAIAAVLTARRGGKKLGEECGCEDEKEPKLKKKEGGAEDPREIPTKVNLVKNKLRAMGLKMSYEPEGDQIDEVQAPLAGPLEMRKIERRTQSQPKPSKHPYLPPSSSLVKQAKVKKKAEMQVAGYEPEGEVVSEKDEAIEAKFKRARTPHLLSQFRKQHPGSRQEPKKPGTKETEAQARERQTHTQVRRAVKHGLTSKEKAESKARERYDSPRD